MTKDKKIAEYKCLNCEFEFYWYPGPAECPLCQHEYILWKNYEELFGKKNN